MGTLNVNLLAVAAVGMVLAGCQSTRFDNDGMDRVTPRPAPLQSAPSGSVTQSQLPPPGGANQFPTAPTTGSGAAPASQGTQVASLPPANAPDVTAGSVAGVWNASLAGQSCKIATGQ